MKKIILNMVMFLLCTHIYGQRRCGSELNLAELQQTNPSMYQRIMDLENRIQESLNNTTMLRSVSQPTITIPVVVHIVYNTNAQNINDAQVHSQIQVLNEDFRRLNADRTNMPNAFTSIAGDANIEFVLAKKDPYGNQTTGITRTFTNQNKFYKSNNDVKFFSRGGQNGWSPYRYLNIWVCNLGDDVSGYAQFPSELYTSPETDGIVINYKYFGCDGSAVNPYNKGRTATHEIGHWLNLWHIWGDDDNEDGTCTSNGCLGSDEVIDTPNQCARNYGCPSFPLTDDCTIFYPGVMFMNYMDYVDDACMNMFTDGQIARMRAVFYGERAEMLVYSHCHNGIQDDTEAGVDCGGSCPPCTDNVVKSCFDGIKNQNETDVDCGGKCLPCDLGNKAANIIFVEDCECGDAYTPESNNITPPSLFSGQNLLYKRNIVNVSHGNISFLKSVGFDSSVRNNNFIKICGEYQANPAVTYESILNGGIFFEEDGIQFCPDKMYKLKFNYWYNYGTGINFSLTDELINSANCVTKDELWFNNNRYNRYSEIYQTSTTDLSQVAKRYNIGNVLAVNPPTTCYDNYDFSNNYPPRPFNADYRYTEVTLLFTPDNYYKQLWVNGNGVFFNSLTIEEFCIPDIEYNSATVNMPNTAKASNTIMFKNIDYTPTDAVEFIAGNTITIKGGVRIAPQNQGSVHLRIDKNICPNNSSMQSSMRVAESLQETHAIETEEKNNTLLQYLVSASDGVSIYPNPVTDWINIQTANPEKIQSIEIRNLQGICLIKLSSIDVREKTRINISNLPAGIYLVMIPSTDKLQSFKLIKK